jgi:hypothetical protein
MYVLLTPFGLVWTSFGWSEYVLGLIAAGGFGVFAAKRVRHTVLERGDRWQVTWWRFGDPTERETHGFRPNVSWSQPAEHESESGS